MDSLDKAEYDNIQYRTRKTEAYLENLGMKVVDVNIFQKRHPEYIDYSIIGDNSIHRIPSRYKVELDAVYQVEFPQDLAENIVDIVNRATLLERDLYESRNAYNISQSNLASIESKLSKLRRVLNDNPGVAEQFEEIMVMAKMAGFDDKLI